MTTAYTTASRGQHITKLSSKRNVHTHKHTLQLVMSLGSLVAPHFISPVVPKQNLR